MAGEIITFNNQYGPPIKRQRVITSCANCRRKKVKCDKQRPVCNGCRKADTPSLCIYQEPSWQQSCSNISSDYLNAASKPVAHITVNASASITKKLPQSSTTTQFRPFQIPNGEGSVPKSYPSPRVYPIQDPVHYPESNIRTRDNNPLPPISQAFPYLRDQKTLSTVLPPINITTNSSNNSSARSYPTPSQYISFYDYEEPVHHRAGRLIATAPLSVASIVKKDPFLRVNLLKLKKEQAKIKNPWGAQMKLKTSKDLVKEIIIEDMNSKGNRLVDERFSKTLIENEGIDEINTTKRAAKTQNSHIFNLNGENYETETIIQIRECLPEEKLIWILVDRYFNGILSAFMPIISEGIFKEKVQEIIGPRKDYKKRIETISISRRFDFAYVGILLIILRLTSLSITKTSNNTPQEKYILANPIDLNVVNVAQMCLNQFKLLRRGALPIMQCCLFMRFYHKFAPEDGDGGDGGDGQVFLGMLLQMANSIGLNRDLNHSSALRDDNKLVNIWRIIWHEIVTLDLRQSLVLGDPILIDENYYDTLLPMLETKINNQVTTNFEIHSSVIENFKVSDDINNIIRDILKLILSIRTMTKIDDLLPKLNKLENFISENFKTLNHILTLSNFTIQDTISKLFKFINYVELKTSLFVIYYHIFLRFPNNHTMLLRIIEIAVELNPLVYLMITTNNERTNYFDSIFGSGSQLVIIPTLITSLQKTNQIECGLIARCLDVKFNHPRCDNYVLIGKIGEEVQKKYDIMRDAFQSLSSDYFHAWRTAKVMTVIQNIQTDLDNSIWDKKSQVNLDTLKEPELTEEQNHFLNIPETNELTQMSGHELNQVYELVSSKKHEEVLMVLLNKTKSSNTMRGEGSHVVNTVYPEHATYQTTTYPQPNQPTTMSPSIVSDFTQTNGDGPVGSTLPMPSPSSLHVNKNAKTNQEIDMLWMQMMGTQSHETTANAAVANANMSGAAGSLNGRDGTGAISIDPMEQIAMFDPGSLGVADMDRILGDPALYDMFGDVSYHIFDR